MQEILNSKFYSVHGFYDLLIKKKKRCSDHRKVIRSAAIIVLSQISWKKTPAIFGCKNLVKSKHHFRASPCPYLV